MCPTGAEAIRARWQRTIIRNGRVLKPDQDIDGGVVVIDDGRIVFAGPATEWRGEHRLDAAHGSTDSEAPGDTAVEVDANGGYICPGFIDMHVHGGGGADTMDADAAALLTIARTHAKYGTTALLPTTVTAPHERLLSVVDVVRQVVGAPTGGARVLGLHLEGPYINPKRAGAQNPKHMRPPTWQELEQLYEAAGPSWRVITMAPELPGSLEATRWLAERGVLVSVGHSDATYDETMAAVEAGARHGTHLFNGMRGWHHREPGCVGALLDNAAVGVELIADGVHVHPAVLRLAIQCKGARRISLITDCISALDLPDGDYKLGDMDVSVRDGLARLRDDEHTIAGSLLTMADAVRMLVRHVGVSVRDAVMMASRNPAYALGVQDSKGALEAGKDGDVVVLDEDLTVQATVVAGQVVYSR